MRKKERHRQRGGEGKERENVSNTKNNRKIEKQALHEEGKNEQK